jgi:chromosome segregation ATPase
MTEPHQFSLEALVAEDGQCVRAGLPESLRREIDAARENSRRAKERVERLDRLIAEYEACLAEFQRRLQELRREHAEAIAAIPAA